MPPTRNPFPFPRYENEETCDGQARTTKKVPFSKPTHLAQKEDPWDRLHNTPTLSSARREVYYFDPEVPNDDLDYNLRSTYNHHEDFLKNKNQMYFQKETFSEDHGRILKNRVKTPPPKDPTTESEIRQWTSPQRESFINKYGAIVSHHSSTTNRGYSRKQDGGFYSI
ncbi:cilia- and flagella-associated protein 276 [Latimeria chalumnae]|uniref:Cilia and flagella associated protein 276 n=1 Tax=Latimeria chalumnae TaxID=7897 RepID=M3XGV0_LATCH|nr:PREDICTED: uncharacterized protein C1orf194 homolog [Latimeria chalumnae]|eukprot:XP_005988434.1 PREDICTED: uncharacterized protein C1orf194 homolog [Latimeria chalumnae]